MTNPTQIYAGPRDAMNAEIGTPDFYEGRYLVQPVGDAEWDAIGAATKTEMKAIIRELRAAYPSATLVIV